MSQYTSTGFMQKVCGIHLQNKKTLGLQKLRVRYDLCKFGFSKRWVNTWNSLPN